MSPIEENLLDKYIKGVNIRTIWTIVICTAVSCSTALSIYYDNKTERELMKLQMTYFEKRIEKLENR